MCKLLRKCQFFSYFQIRTNPQTCLYIFKCHTKLNHFQTPQHLFSKTRQNLLKNKVCCGHKVLGRLNSLNNGLFRDYLQAYYQLYESPLNIIYTLKFGEFFNTNTYIEIVLFWLSKLTCTVWRRLEYIPSMCRMLGN